MIRPFDPARDDYDALAALWTELHPDLPRVGSIWRERDQKAAKREDPRCRVVAHVRGRLAGVGEFEGCPVAGEPGQLQISLAVPPGELAQWILEELYAELYSEMAPWDPPCLVAYVADTQPWMLAFYRRVGFEEAQRTASSELRIEDAAPDALPAALERLAARGYEVLSVEALAAEGGDWHRPYHALDTAVMADIPFLGPTRVEPFERFVARVEDPARFDRRATFVARHAHTGELVGVSLLSLWDALPSYAFAGLTGVVRTHRRRGIARVLKLATFEHARTRGVERITTLNEIHNPMLALNRELGFRTQHIQLTMRKSL